MLGLLIGLAVGVEEFEARWIGWPGVNVPDEDGQRTLTKALAVKVRSLMILQFEIYR